MSRSGVRSQAELRWQRFAMILMGLCALAGAVAAVSTVVAYHALTTNGVQTPAIVESAWRVKGGRDCSVDFTDTGGTQRVERVSGCGNVQPGQAISVTYDRTDPSIADPTGSVTAFKKLGLAALLALFSVPLSFATWIMWRRSRAKPPIRTRR